MAVLCEGDPFFYGSFMYLYDRLADWHATEIIPGVSSLTACAARLGQPLCGRNDMLSVVPAPLPDDALEARLMSADSAAIIKVGRHLGRVRDVLGRIGKLDCSRYVERATLPQEKTMPLSEVTGDGAPYFSMILVYDGSGLWSR